MSDLTDAIQPKADQLTADDLISGPKTINITKVSVVKTPEQPVAISFEGDGGKPWKPCKTMCRVLVACWGPDSQQFVGRSVTLYRDPSVKWGGLEVGGIRISHVSHINGAVTMALTVTRGSKKPFTVKPLAASRHDQNTAQKPTNPTQAPAARRTWDDWLNKTEADLIAATTPEAVDAIIFSEQVKTALNRLVDDKLDRLNGMIKAALDRVANQVAADDEPPLATEEDDEELNRIFGNKSPMMSG